MPEAPSAPPPVNPVSAAFNAAADAAVAASRSPLEASLDRATAERAAAGQQAQLQTTNQQRPVIDFNRPAVDHAIQPRLDGDALARARAQDNGVAPTPPPAKPADAAPAEPEADPSVASEPWKAHKKPKERATAADWNAVKGKHEAEVAALRKELDAARQGAVGDVTKHPEFAKLKQQHDEYLDALKQVAVERDPEFKARYEPRREAVMSKLRQVAGAGRERLEAILKLPAGEFRDAAIEQALGDYQPSTKATIMGQLQVLAMVDAERDADLASRKALYESNQQQAFTQQQQAARDRDARLNKALDKQIAAWGDPEEGMPFLQTREGDAKWNAQVEKRIALARSIFSGEGDPVSLSQASLKAASFDAALQMAYEATQEVERLTTQLARYTNIQPGAGSLAASIMTSGRNDATAPNADPFSKDYIQHFGSGLEAARRADYMNAGGGGQ